MSMPLPPNSVLPPSKKIEDSGELSENEYGFILDSTLKEKHRKDSVVIAFIDSFIACKSISQASSEAGIHKTVGYSIRHRKDVANAIQKLIDKSTVKYGFDNSEVMERVKEVVDFDPIDMQNPDGSFKTNLYDIPPEARRCLKKLKVKNIFNQVEDLNGMKSKIIIGEIIEYEFYDKLKASELVGKEKEMFKNTTKIEHGLTKDMANVLLASVNRADKAIENIEKDIIDVTPIGE